MRYNAVEVGIRFVQEFRGCFAKLYAKLMLDTMPEGNGPVGTTCRNQLKHHRPQNMIGRKQFIEGIRARRKNLRRTGKVKHGVAGKRHRLISHNAKYIRQNRGTEVISDADAKVIKKWAPYGLN